MRRLWVLGVVTVVALTGSGAPHAQAPPPSQRVWTGTWEEHDFWEGHSKFGRSQAQISFVYVEGRDEFGGPRWDSRRLTWSAVWEESSFDHVVVLTETEPGVRGSTTRRYHQDSATYCAGGGTLELGPAMHGDEDDLTPEQTAQLRPNCVATFSPRDSSIPTPPPERWTRDTLLQLPSMPNDDALTRCAYETSWPKGGRPAGSFSVKVSAPVTAVMEVSRRAEDDYARFVPTPGGILKFTASVPSGTARFRFELDPEGTSHFPGYATNADIDDAFLAKHELKPGRYANDGPDVIFHPKYHSAQDWSRVEPLILETARPQSAAVVTVTTLDYGAVSRLRASVWSEECGDWLPVPIKFYPDTREFVAIPMDEDNNLIADSLDDYAGRESGADDDAEPKGNGMAGDGLTAFEEYRGFLTNAAACSDTLQTEHVRTNPRAKDLFVHTVDPDYAQALPLFALSSGLAVHGICEKQYVDNDTRIVNFTLQTSQLRRWQSHNVSGEVPQHGIHLMYKRLRDNWPTGITCNDPNCLDDSQIGPPGKTYAIWIDKTQFTTTGSALARSIVHTVTHELGHAVGIPHHNDTVVNWTIQPGRRDLKDVFIAPGGDCVDPEFGTTHPKVIGAYLNETFVGCLAWDVLALQHGQRSGDAECPMRYRYATFHEAPGSNTQRTADVTANRTSNGDSGPPTKFETWTGRFFLYDNDNDPLSLGRLCQRKTGSNLNDASRGDGNHAGDAARACADQLVINDSVLPRGGQ